MDKVLVTGGSGFVGKNLQEVKPNWTYLSSKDCDLTDKDAVRELFEYHKPDAIVHLAGRVGGIKDNAANQATFFYLNTLINTNVIHQAHLAGVDRVLSSLSTCAFPDEVRSYPFSEIDFMSGPPAVTNLSYGMTKRMLHVASMSYRKQFGRNYSTFCPSNIYGPHDDFESEKSHFVPAMIRKIANADDGDTLEFWGTGRPLRQQMYVGDLAKLIPILLDWHWSTSPLIVAPHENYEIREIIKICLQVLEKDVNISFNGELGGQFRKDGSNEALLELVEGFEFTKLKDGLLKTYEWYEKNKTC